MIIRVLLADDHRIIREGLHSLLSDEPDMEIVGEADNGRKTVKLVRELIPNVVLMDVSMPDLNGIDATGQITSEFPNVKIIALSMHQDEQFVAGMLMAGASGYLLKDCSVDELAGAIRSVTKGGVCLSPGIANHVVKHYIDKVTNGALLHRPSLTVREKEVLQLVAEGKTSKEIGSALCISPKTVETHRHRIMGKLGTKNVAELTKYALRIGATSLEK